MDIYALWGEYILWDELATLSLTICMLIRFGADINYKVLKVHTLLDPYTTTNDTRHTAHAPQTTDIRIMNVDVTLIGSTPSSPRPA